MDKLILGIDTGGTFTDGVVLDVATDKVLAKSKVHTTKEDLSIGIIDCIKALQLTGLSCGVSLVCLSTTLATNAVVEEKTSRIGLITTGSTDMHQDITVKEWSQVSGRINILGQITDEIVEDEVINAAKSMENKIDALVISGYACVRNPAHELKIKRLVEKILSVPIICAHELSSSLGFKERTTTAVLNARLMPIIDDLIKKTKYALKKMGIDAQMAVMKGNGTMMLQADALDKPVETILSGPAASAVGGAFLTEIDDFYVVDLGGTTMDIADMREGKVSVVEEGAEIQGKKTKVRAVDIHTFGLGGESRLYKNKGDFSFGPMKAIPFCRAASQYPHLISELETLHNNTDFYIPSSFVNIEGLWLSDTHSPQSLSTMEEKIIEKLRDGPHSLLYLLQGLTNGEREIGVNSLLRKNIVQIISLTPTDLLHITKKYVMWDRTASITAMKILSLKSNNTWEQLTAQLMTQFTNQLTYALIKSVFAFDKNYHKDIIENSWFYNSLFHKENKTGITCKLRKPIVGLGAPAKAWMRELSKTLETSLLLPEHGEVANAIGAAKGWVGQHVEILIRYNQQAGAYRIYLPWEMLDVPAFEEAESCAKEKGKQFIRDKMDTLGVEQYEITTDSDIKYLSASYEENDFIYECKIIIMAAGKPACIEQ